MDSDLKCNILTCRRPLTDKAVVTTCSHIFCVDCANKLFNASRLCPACETGLSEPDDVVVSTSSYSEVIIEPSQGLLATSLKRLQNSKYHAHTLSLAHSPVKSVLSGLTPSIILEICSRAISFWQYQSHQENSFQQAVVRNINDKNAQLQKQLDNVVREANGEINLLSNKNAELERDLELERRKVRDLQDAARERDKEYQKLKVQHDKIKRKALLAPNAPTGSGSSDDQQHKQLRSFSNPLPNGLVGSMEISGIQRTPLVNRTGASSASNQHTGWGLQQQQQQHVQHQTSRRAQTHRQPFAGQTERVAYQSGHTSDRSAGSLNEVENMLMAGQQQQPRPAVANAGWSTAPTPRTRAIPRVFAPQPNQRMPGGFRPAGVPRS